MAETNMRKLKPSKKAVNVGDVFVLQMPDGLYLFGRVVRTDADAGGFGPANLIYIHRVRSDSKDLPDRAELRGDKLLIPPVMINNLPWVTGYFETVSNIPVRSEELASRHTFFDVVTEEYVNELGHPAPAPTDHVGDFGLGSFRTVDDDVSDALGFARVPD